MPARTPSPGKPTSREPGMRAGREPGMRAGREPGMRAGREPGTQTDAKPGTHAGPELHSEARQAALTRRVRWLVAATITYNLVEAAVALAAGTIASSTALLGFGLDSLIEVSSAAAVAWQFTARDPQRRERTALRVIAVSFFALAAYVTVQAGFALTGHTEAHPSTAGIALAGSSLLVMPVLSQLQRRAGRELGSRSAVADSKQTLLCTYLSAILLAGLAANAAFGWSWADPLAALAIGAIAAREGHLAWRGESCCAPRAGVRCDCAAGCECQADPSAKPIS